MGKDALSSNTTGGTNTAIGVSSLQYNSTGQSNTACGFRCLNQNITGQDNTALGYQVLFSNNTGVRNSGFGFEALLYNYDGVWNTAGGFHSMRNNTGGSINTSYGYYSLYTNTTGNWNTATGCQALYLNNGSANTADGINALYNNNSGCYNTATGREALFYNASGWYDTAIGYYAGNNNGTNPSNFSALGYNAGHVGSATNTIEIGNSSVTYIGGVVGWSAWSDRRVKDNIQSNVPGLTFITKLKPVTYHFNVHRLNELCGITDSAEYEGKYNLEKIIQTGFIAQDVESAAKACAYNFSGVNAPMGKAGLYSLRYSDFVVPLVKAVQELDSTNKELIKINDELKNEISQIKSVLSEDQQQRLTVLKTISIKPVLEQNIPNPFNKNSVIKYELPANFSSAAIKIYSQQGVEMKSFTIAQSGKGEIVVEANTLVAGIYSYTLIVDNEAADIKQMIVTK